MKRFFMLSAIIFVMSIISLQICFAGDNEYKDKQDRYSFVLPDKWVPVKDEFDVTFEYDSKEFYVAFYVYGYPLEKDDKLTVKELAAQSQECNYTEQGIEVCNKIIEKIDTQIDGVPAVDVRTKSEIKGTVDGKSYSDISIIDEFYFIKNNHMYTIGFTTTENVYDRFKEDIQNIVKSFKTGTNSFSIKN